jgi:hypothetical protein
MNITSNYNGSFLGFLYLLLEIGNQVLTKGAAYLITGIQYKESLPVMSQTEDPIGAYTDDVPASSTVTTTYAERVLEPQDMTLFEKDIKPNDLRRIWPQWQPGGDLTNLMMNVEFLGKMFMRYFNGAGTQIAKCFWQGDTTSGTPALTLFNGIITRLVADGGYIAVTPAGAITKANVVDRVQEVWDAIPDKFLDDPEVYINMNTTDYKLLQAFNNDAKKTTVGVLSEDIQSLFLNKRIRHFTGLPKNYIVAAKSTLDERSNLFMGAFATEDSPVFEKLANLGKNYGARIDWSIDANYRVASEIVLYKPS